MDYISLQKYRDIPWWGHREEPVLGVLGSHFHFRCLHCATVPICNKKQLHSFHQS
jgi:hypothetical protein